MHLMVPAILASFSCLARESRMMEWRHGRRESALFFYLSVFGLLSCLLLGGGTRGGLLSDALLQLVSIPLLLAALWRILDAPLSREARWALAFCGAILVVPLVQLVPLPPAISTHLPGRAVIAEVQELISRPRWWVPISLAPEATWLAGLSFLPALAIFLCTITLDWRDRRRMSFTLIAFAVTSVFLGLIQLWQGPASPLRFFEITNPSDAVGFFANRNHFAALLYSAIIFAVAVLAPQVATFTLGHKKRGGGVPISSPLGPIAAGVALTALISGVAMARSRAGIILTVVAFLLAGFALGGGRRRLVPIVAIPQALAVIVVLAITLLQRPALSRLLDRFDADPLADARLVFAKNTVAATKSVMPVGAGLGSFPSLYATVEKPADLLIGVYANHAHNDLLEIWLETGFIGPILLCVFLIWAIRKAVAEWTAPNPGRLPAERALIRAAILAILLLLGHSLVDYPLRTSAMMGIFAFCGGLLFDPAVSGDRNINLWNRSTKAATQEGGGQPGRR
jgi:O-antigen ligase